MKLIALILAVLFAPGIWAGSCDDFWADATPIDENLACLSWSKPTQNADGTPLTDLAGYRLSWGTVAGALSDSVELTDLDAISHALTLTLPPGVISEVTYFFAIQAFDESGNLSLFSPEVSKTLRFVDSVPPKHMLPLQIEMNVRFVVPNGELVHP